MKLIIILVMVISAVMLPAFNYFSPVEKSEQLIVEQLNEPYKLKYNMVIVDSEQLFADTLKLVKNRDYIFNYQTGVISFNQIFGLVTLTYKIYPEDLISNYYIYETVNLSDSLIIKEKQRSNLYYQSNTNLNITGSKTISLSVSNDKDLGVDQSLFLQMDGELGENLNIEAQLTDSQSPITPEGDSREISSLDRVFIRLYGKQYELAFGDLDMEFTKTVFMNYKPQFEGLKASWNNRQEITTALAISKGKGKTTFITAIEGKQGPYYLSEMAGGLQIIPGSEDVFLDGSGLQRGSDYVIDYSEGSITFSNLHILTSNSFIQVTFQYSDEDFRQNMYMINSKIHLWKNLEIKAGMIIQKDDDNSPLQDEFSEADMDSLQMAGDDQAYGNGVIYTPDGGDYVISETGDYYIYIGDGDGDYNIAFSYMGNGLGNYDPATNGYTYVGQGIGSYLPLRELSSPISKSNFDINLRYILSSLYFETEMLATEYDRNILSSRDDDDNDGYAYFAKLGWKPDYDKIKPNSEIYFRGQTDKLNSFAEINDPLQSYELEAIPDSLGYNEMGGKFNLSIYKLIKPSLKISRKEAESFVIQNYSDLGFVVEQYKVFPHLKIRWMDWDQEFEDNEILSGKGETQEGLLRYEWEKIVVSAFDITKSRQKEYAHFPMEGSKTEIRNISGEYKADKKTALKLEYEQEYLDSINVSSLKFASNWDEYKTSKKVKTSWQLNFANHSFSGSYSRLSVKQDSTQHYDLAELNMQNSFLKDGISFNSRYNLRNVEFYPKLRELVYDGFGILDSTGVYAEDEDDAGYSYQIKEIDYNNPKMAVEVNANSGIYITPSRFAPGYWKRVRFETELQISENSFFPKKESIYLLKPEVIQNETYTNYGRYRLEQKIWVDILPKLLQGNVKYSREKILDNRYVGDSSLQYRRKYMGSMDFSGIKKTRLKIEVSREITEESLNAQKWILQSGELEVRNRINRNTSLRTSMIYFQEEGSENGDNNDYDITGYEIRETVIHSFSKKYKLFSNIKIRYNQRKGYDSTSSVDKMDGVITKWSSKIDYKVNSFTYAGLEYSGDDYSDRKAKHKLKLEIKAEF